MDARNWWGNRPVFTSRIDIYTVLPEETDVLEGGPRVAVALADQNIRQSFHGSVSIRFPVGKVGSGRA